MSQPTFNPTMETALRLHLAGRLVEAADLYRQIIASEPQNAQAWHYLGVVSGQQGNLPAAVELIGRAITLNPNVPEFHTNLATFLQGMGRFVDAAAACRQAIKLREQNPEAYNNLGSALLKMGALDEAAAAFGRAIELKENFAEAHSNLGSVFKEQGRREEAVTAYRRAVALRPELAEAHSNLGNALRQNKQFDEAWVELEQAVRLRPNFAEFQCNLGGVLQELGRLDEAMTTLRHAVELDPAFVNTYCNLCVVLRHKGLIHEAMTACEHALAIDKHSAEAHFARAYLLLLSGDLAEAWPDFEWRRKLPAFSEPRFKQPMWNGQKLQGRTILLHAEQGLGDTLQFARYVPRITHNGGRVILACQPALHRLLSGVPRLEVTTTNYDSLPPFDVHCPLLSLPGIFQTDLQSIPAPLNVQVGPELAAAWKDRVASSQRLKVGLVWAGNPEHPNDRNRSIAASRLKPLFDLSGVEYFSLQKGARTEQSHDAATWPVRDLTGEFHDLTDTAALIANLDLVISVDTSIAHLAATMGKPVWLMLPFAPDWRWMLGRTDSPWYPTLRLFRQPSPGEWNSVLSNVAGELQEVIHNRSAPAKGDAQ